MAQKRRKALAQKRRQRRITALCIAGGIGAVVLSLTACLLIFGVPAGEQALPPASSVSALPYDAGTPFSLSDLTAAQIAQLREQGRLSLSDGPRGVSIGDSLDVLLERYPSNFAEEQPDGEQILYCALYFPNRNGLMTALPPRGLLSADSSTIYVTLLAPTSPYPEGTSDNYGDYEHVYCRYTIEPDTMTVTSIVLGIEQ